jgi:hypothetical protein
MLATAFHAKRGGDPELCVFVDLGPARPRTSPERAAVKMVNSKPMAEIEGLTRRCAMSRGTSEYGIAAWCPRLSFG